MQRPYRLCLLLASLLACLSGCIDSYLPNVPAANLNYLVVSGFINAQGATTIQLSRSLGLSATGTPPAESSARVAIVGSDGQRFLLVENPKGTYTSDSLALNPALTYQLSIGTAAGRQYATELQAVKEAPPIDQLRWRYENNGVQLYVSTHDAAKASVYYRWQTEETWQFTSAYKSLYQYNYITQRIEFRTDDIYHCWHTTNSNAIVQTNTTRLSQDVVKDFPLLFIPASSAKLYIRYSILVKQQSQAKDEYDYWETLRKNTELSGTINDPLPTQLTGNVHSLTDATEPVLGYVGVHAVSTQRLFIDRSEVPFPPDNQFDLGYSDCKLVFEDRTCYRGDNCLLPGATAVFNTPYLLPVLTGCDSVTTPCKYLTNLRYYGSTPECVDCRLRGTNVRPSFWR